MRKIILCAVLILTGIVPVMAQTHYKSHVHVGGHAGITLSEMDFVPTTKQAFLPGMTMGVSFRYAEERHVGLMAEINFTQRGWKEDFEGAPLNYSRTLTYLELPIMTHIFFGSPKFKGYLNLGPQVNYMIGSSISSDFDYEHPESVQEMPEGYRVNDQMWMPVKNKFDYGICAGIGGEAILKHRHSIMLEARFYYGLGNIYSDSKKDTFSASRGICLSVRVGYMFRIK